MLGISCVCTHDVLEHSAVSDLCSRCACPGYKPLEPTPLPLGLALSPRPVENGIYLPGNGSEAWARVLPDAIGITIWLPQEKSWVVLFTEPNSNQGRSITNSAEEMIEWARLHCFSYGQRANNAFRWFKRYESRPTEIHEILVSNLVSNSDLTWKHIPYDEFRLLIADASTAELLMADEYRIDFLFEARE
jgi:hypothetical protein